MKQLNKKKLQNFLDHIVDNEKIFGASFCVKHRGEIWRGTSGNLHLKEQYFITSVTKLFVTAIILHLNAKGILGLDDKIDKYLDAQILRGLHTLNGKDYAGEITLRHLLAHTSGLQDYFYFEQGDMNGESLFDKLFIKGEDRPVTFDEVIEFSKRQKPLFVPGCKGMAHYSDTNFQLLGRIIENVTGESFSINGERLIFKPLGLAQTYVYQNALDEKPVKFYSKNKRVSIPKAMASFGSDGGMVSSVEDMMVFLEEFFSGDLLSLSRTRDLKTWNRIFSFLWSGVGIHRFRPLWISDPFRRVPELIGHSGISGVLAYCNLDSNLYITGTINQCAYPYLSFDVMTKLIKVIQA